MGNIGKKIFEEYGTETAIFIIISFFIITYILKQVIPMWINTAIKEEETKNNKEIEKLKSELDKQKQQLEHMHQVSQVTYQKLFEKKINIYQNLIKTRTRYTEEYKNKGVLQEINVTDFSEIEQLRIEELNAIEDIIKDDKLFISNELLEIYEKVIEGKEKFDSEFAELALTIYKNNIDDPYNEYGRDEIYTKIYKQTAALFLEFNNVLDSDILKIKKKINLD